MVGEIVLMKDWSGRGDSCESNVENRITEIGHWISSDIPERKSHFNFNGKQMDCLICSFAAVWKKECWGAAVAAEIFS